MANAIAQITRTMTLLPGDIISMGTRVGGEKSERGEPAIPSITKVNLNGATEAVSVTIAGLGTLSNPIITTPV